MRILILLALSAATLAAQTKSLSVLAKNSSNGDSRVPEAVVQPRSVVAIPPDFDRAILAVYPHGIPLSVAERLTRSPQAFDKLATILSQYDRRASWENAVLLAGLSGNTRAFRTLFLFLQTDDSPAANCRRTGQKGCAGLDSKTSTDVYYAKANVPVAMGLLLNRLNARLLDDRDLPPDTRTAAINARTEIINFLSKGSRSGLACWPGVIWKTELFGNVSSGTIYLELARQCIEGLGMSGDEEALTRLVLLRDKYLPKIESKLKDENGRDELLDLGYNDSFINEDVVAAAKLSVSRAIEANGQVNKNGINAYYGQR